MKKIKHRIIWVSLQTILLSLAFYSCNSNTEEQKEANTGTPVKTVNPFTTTMTKYLQLNANTVYLKKENVRAAFQGYIKKIFKNIGDKIEQNEVLLAMQTRESYAMDNSANKPIEVNKTSVLLKAQSNGILTRLYFHEGDFVSEGEQIAEISNPGSLAVMLNVPYQNSSDIKIGQNCILLLLGGKKANGKITSSIPSVDAASQTQTFLISRIELLNLPENLNLAVQIPVSTINNATVINKNCILSNENLDEFWIMKLADDNTAVRTNIKKGIENDSLVQVISPALNLKDEIISEGGYGLPDTAKVIIER